MNEFIALTGQSCARAIRNPNRTNRLRARAQSWTGQCIVRPANPSFPGAYSRNLSRQDWTGQRVIILQRQGTASDAPFAASTGMRL